MLYYNQLIFVQRNKPQADDALLAGGQDCFYLKLPTTESMASNVEYIASIAFIFANTKNTATLTIAIPADYFFNITIDRKKQFL